MHNKISVLGVKKNKFIEFIKDYGLLLTIVVGPVILIIVMGIISPKTDIKRVHWHNEVSYDLCGDTTQLKDPGKHLKLHGHDDGKIHIEGNVDMLNRTETLGKFMGGANINFSSTQIGKYKNGDKCAGTDIPGKVSVEVNGKENNEFRNLILGKDDNN